MNIVLTNNLRLSDVPESLRDVLTERLSFPNPKWLENQRMGRWNRGTPKLLRYYDTIRGGGLWIPRGYLRQLIVLCRKQGIAWNLDDRRHACPSIDVGFSGKLKPFQSRAVSAMLKRDFLPASPVEASMMT